MKYDDRETPLPFQRIKKASQSSPQRRGAIPLSKNPARVLGTVSDDREKLLCRLRLLKKSPIIVSLRTSPQAGVAIP